jgi:hypothetical protein
MKRPQKPVSHSRLAGFAFHAKQLTTPHGRLNPKI